jgi:hypothetical protein
MPTTASQVLPRGFLSIAANTDACVKVACQDRQVDIACAGIVCIAESRPRDTFVPVKMEFRCGISRNVIVERSLIKQYLPDDGPTSMENISLEKDQPNAS